MKSGTELARVRVQIIDSVVDAKALSSSGDGSSRPPGDWLPPASAMFEAAERRGSSRPLRAEFVGAGDEWIDVIGKVEDGWLVRLRFEHGEDGPRIAGIELRPSAAAIDPQVGSRYLRRLGFGRLLEEVDDLLTVDYLVGELAGGTWRRRVHRPGRGGRPDMFYAEWARRYVDALQAAPNAPVRRLVDEEAADGRHVTAAQLRGFLNKARTRGLLTGAAPGRPGGALTDTARGLVGGA